ncbi:MAG: M15 family metallopeptidase [Pseudomonadota bacterium]
MVLLVAIFAGAGGAHGPGPVAIAHAQHAADRGSASKIPDSVWSRMQGRSWHRGRGCPSPERLSLLTIPYRDFGGQRQTGRMIVARAVADQVLDVFAAIHRAGFPIASMRLVSDFGGSDARSMAANNTSAFNCRLKSSGRGLSDHARGLAIDINPVQNPYVARGRVQPVSARKYARPGNRRGASVGVITRNGPVVRAFRRIGWGWGGNWRRVRDYQHFSRSGR